MFSARIISSRLEQPITVVPLPTEPEKDPAQKGNGDEAETRMHRTVQ